MWSINKHIKEQPMTFNFKKKAVLLFKDKKERLKESILEKEAYCYLQNLFAKASLNNMRVYFLKDGVSESIRFGSLVFIHTESKKEDIYQIYVGRTNESLFMIGRNKRENTISCYHQPRRL